MRKVILKMNNLIDNLFSDDLGNDINRIFEQIDSVEMLIELEKKHKNFNYINASILSYKSEILSRRSLPLWIFTNHVKEVISRFKQIIGDEKKDDIKKLFFPLTRAELVLCLSDTSFVAPIHYPYSHYMIVIFNQICKEERMYNCVIEIDYNIDKNEINNLESLYSSKINNICNKRVELIWKIFMEVRKNND